VDIRLIVVLTGWLVGWWLLWRVPRLDDDIETPLSPGCPPVLRRDVAIIVPARNEAGGLGDLLRSLDRQTVQSGQIIVVDDQSTDATAAVAAGAGVTVIRGEPLPDGWTGKAWACHQASRSTDADVVVFVDADVVLAPDGLAAVLDQLDGRHGLVSVQPYHRVHRAYERLSALFNLVGMMGVGAASPGHRGRSRGAFGPVLACARRDYVEVGGHEAVRGEIVDDVALADRFRRRDLPVTTLGGGSAAAFRMYPDGLGQLVEGWSKNFATGAASISGSRLLLIGFWVTTMLITVQSLVELAAGRVAGFDLAVTTALAGYILFVIQLSRMLRQLGNFGIGTAAAYPALVVIFVVVFARSVWLTLVRRRVTWRGRSVSLSSARRWDPMPENIREADR
jgi:4,4'-diaponeurosporenoate glycosyltransferase